MDSLEDTLLPAAHIHRCNHQLGLPEARQLLQVQHWPICISLHNECEASDVLEELIRPAISYGSNLNIVETVEDTPEKDPIQVDLIKVDHEQRSKAITSVRLVTVTGVNFLEMIILLL